MEKKKVWAIVCGAIRQEFELITVLATLCEYRSRGLLEGIVISTWKGEPDNIDGLRNKLRFLGIYVVESAPVDEAQGKYMNMNYARQATQLNAGLNFIPNDVFVLKCRTDFCNNYINKLEDVLQFKVDLHVCPHGNCNFGLNYKICVFEYSISFSFCFNDICFFAYKNDMYKMILFENTMNKYASNYMPDCLFFMNIFIHRFPIISQYLKTIDYFAVNRLFMRGMIENMGKDGFTLPRLIIKFYALYFVIVNCCFHMLNSQNRSVNWDEMRICDVFMCNPRFGLKKTWLTGVDNATIIEKIVSGNVVMDETYKMFYQEILKLSYGNYSLSQHIISEDIEEMSVWLERNFKINPKTILRVGESNYVYSSEKKDVDFEVAINVLFSEVNSKKLSSVLRECCFGKNYYASIEANFDEIRDIDKKVFEIALYAVSRTMSPLSLRMVSEMLINEEVNPGYLDAARYVFERYSQSNSRIFSFPMSGDKLFALYNYSVYMERNGNNIFAAKFYEQIISVFNIVVHREGSSEYICYERALPEILALVANEKYQEYASNTSIKNITDFLVEICGENPFKGTTLNWFRKNQFLIYERIMEKYGTENLDGEEEN